MTQPQGVPVAIILPPPPAVFCPVLPPIPQMSKVTGAVAAIQPLPCLGSQCGFYVTCQGELSPLNEKRNKIADRIDTLKVARTVLEKGQSLPMLGMFSESLVEVVDARIAKLEVVLASLTPTKAPTALPTEEPPAANA